MNTSTQAKLKVEEHVRDCLSVIRFEKIAAISCVVQRQAIHSIRRCQAERSQEITELCASMNERVRQQANEHTEKLEGEGVVDGSFSVWLNWLGPYKVITEQLSEYDRVISRITQMINTKSEVELITQHRMLSGALSKLPSISIPLENTILSSSLSRYEMLLIEGDMSFCGVL